MAELTPEEQVELERLEAERKFKEVSEAAAQKLLKELEKAKQ